MDCVTKEGELLILLQNEKGIFLCPVCGSPELNEPPYNTNGEPSFNMCSCGFEFGFDDSPLASSDAVAGVVNNWDRYRLIAIDKASQSKETLIILESNLLNIGYKLAFDLLPIKINENT
jgi:hypothetical protein